MSKKKSSLLISPKMLKKKPSLAVCGSVCGEKKFWLIFSPFYLFNQKKNLNKSKILSGFASFKHGKKNKTAEYFSDLFWDRQIYV